MLDDHQLTTIFCQIDDFCNELEHYTQAKLLTGPGLGKRGPSCCLSMSEIMTLLVSFQSLRFRHFKAFYTFALSYWKCYFPRLPSYQRIVELLKGATIPLTIFIHINAGKHTGVYYIDSSCLPVCHLKRCKRHKTFEGIAELGRTSVGWFFGLKLHLVINDKGELIAFKITRGNQHDAKAAPSLLKTLKGKAFGDKGYLGKKLFAQLMESGLKMITRKRKNMTPMKLTDYERQLLNQRNIVETVINHLKHHYQVWHTRHRSIFNAMTHLLAALAAYTIEPLKISAIKLLSAQKYQTMAS